jgi:hypothetical protein
MKGRLLIVAILFVLCETSLHAQVKFGLKGGASAATQNVEFPFGSTLGEEYNSIMGFVAGISAEIPLKNRYFSIQPELLYAQKGVEEVIKHDLGYRIIEEIETINLNYIELPLLAKFNLDLGNSFRASLYSGVVVGILLNSKDKLVYDNVEQEIPQKEYTRLTDLGVNFGFGIEFNTITTISLDARYTMGLENVYNQRSPGQPIAKNRAWYLMMGFAI